MGRRSSIPTNGAAIRAIRENAGLSVSTLLQRLETAQGISMQPDSLRKIERGIRNTSPEVAKAIAKVLRIDIAAILATPTPKQDNQSTPDVDATASLV
jgi:transcriptional regulator with XRE-family HTH domain